MKSKKSKTVTCSACNKKLKDKKCVRKSIFWGDEPGVWPYGQRSGFNVLFFIVPVLLMAASMPIIAVLSCFFK